MPLTEADIEIVHAIYDSATRPEAWTDTLQRLAGALGGGAAVLAISDSRYQEASISHYSPAFSDLDFRHYMEVLLPHDRIEPVISAPAGSVVTDEDVWPDRNEFWNNAVVRWRNERFGLPHSWGMNLNNREGWRDAILIQAPAPLANVHRAKSADFFPHLANAVKFSRLRAIAEARYRQFALALDRLDLGIVMLQSGGKVMFANSEAHRISEERGALTWKRDGELRAFDAADNATLRRQISAALAPGEAGEPVKTDGGRFTAQGKDGRDACLVEILSIRDPEFGTGAMVVLIDPLHHTSFETDGLSDLYALTRAEADVCKLLTEGFGRNEIAERRGSAPNTVKAQIASILSKTGRPNRASLLRLVCKINPPFKR